MVYPTHGAGSLCSTGIASTSWSTIGYERRHDPLLGPLEVDAFARALLAGQPTIPRYFARMRPMNQAGPRLLGATMPAIEPLAGDELDAALARRRARRRHPDGRGPRPPAHPGLAVDPGRPVVRDVARLGGRRGSADRPARQRRGRPRRPRPAGGADRLRDDRRPCRRRASRLARIGPAGPGRERLRRRSPGEPAGGRRAGRARRHRRPAGVRVRGRPRAGFGAHRRGRAAGHARQASARPPDRHDLCQRLPLERGGLDAPRGRVRARRGGRWRAAGLGGAWLRDRLRTGRRRPDASEPVASAETHAH